MQQAVAPVISPPTFNRLGRPLLWQWALFLALATVVVAPIAMVIADSFDVSEALDKYRFGVSNWVAAVQNREIAGALRNTSTIVALRTVIGFIIAIPLAWIVARTNIPASRHLEFGFWVAFFVPNLAFIQAWTFLLEGRRGLINQLLHSAFGVNPAALDIYSYWGIIWVHLMSQTSALFVLLVAGFRNMDSSLEEAARITGASKWTVMRDILVPLSRPLISMLTVFAIIRGMQSYEVEAVLGGPVGISVYSTLVVSMIADEPPRIAQATALSSFILLMLIPLIMLHRLYVGWRNYATVSGKMKVTLTDLGPWRWPAFFFVFGFILVQTLVPLFATLAGSFMTRWGFFSIPEPWTTRWWLETFHNPGFINAFFNTLMIGLISGFAAVAVCFVLAYVIIRMPFRGSQALDFISWLPWAIPGVLLSLGMVALVLSIPPLRLLHGSIVVLVVAMVLFRLPLGVQLLKTGFMQVNRELEEASTTCGSRRVPTLLRINVPILMPLLVVVGLMTFVTAVNEVSGVVLLASTDTRTLSLMSLDYLVGARLNKEAAAVITSIMILMCIGVALGAKAFGVNLGEVNTRGRAARDRKTG
jgi:iron(III) transport system permease protein